MVERLLYEQAIECLDRIESLAWQTKRLVNTICSDCDAMPGFAKHKLDSIKILHRQRKSVISCYNRIIAQMEKAVAQE